jgi:hypothetical protein
MYALGDWQRRRRRQNTHPIPSHPRLAFAFYFFFQLEFPPSIDLSFLQIHLVRTDEQYRRVLRCVELPGVLSQGRFGMMQELKMVAATQFPRQRVRFQHQLFCTAMQEIKNIAASHAEAATIKAIFQRVMAEIESVPAPKFIQRFWRCVAAEATRVAVVGYPQIMLSVDDDQAIQDYSGEGYIQMNESLHSNNTFTPPEQDRVVAVIKAMSKLKKFKRASYCIEARTCRTALFYRKVTNFKTWRFSARPARANEPLTKSYLFIIQKCRTGVDIMNHFP